MEISTFECFSYVQQEFLVCVTVHKAANLSVFNSDTYVKITLDKKSKTTAVFQNSENPLFNEYFVFELICTLPELLRFTVLFEVKKKVTLKKDTSIGELFIDLTTVWNQQGHSFYKKWGKLESPIDAKGPQKTRGHLQIDLSIVTRNEPPAPVIIENLDYDDVEKNLLQPEPGKEGVIGVQYKVVIYKGYIHKKLDCFVQVSFAGMSGKTKVEKNTSTPEWNERITFMWLYPSLSQTFLIQLMTNDMMQWKCISDYEIHFDEIVFPGKLPSIGPTYIQLYDCLDAKNYVGRILIEIMSENTKGKDNTPQRIVESKSTGYIIEKNFWVPENFFIECIIWQGDFIHSTSNSIKFTLQCGEESSKQIECYPHTQKLTTWRYFQQDKPHKAIHLNTILPDYRCKYEPDHFLNEFAQTMRSQLENFKLFELKYPGNVKLHAKCLKALITLFKEILKQGKKRLQYNGFKQLTDWDRNRINFFDQLYETLQIDFDAYKKSLKGSRQKKKLNIVKVSKELMIKLKEIDTIILTRAQDNWPDLILNLWAGSKVVATCKLNALNYIYSHRIECRSLLCGRRHNLILKPITCQHTCKNCGCIYAKVDSIIWIGTEAEHINQFGLYGWIQKEPFCYDIVHETMFDCKIYIHQGKVRPGEDDTGLCDAKVRVTFLHFAAETSTVFTSLSPIWNEMIIFSNIRLPGTSDSYLSNPPLLELEVLDADTKNKTDYIGCGVLRLSVNIINDNISPLQNVYEKSLDDQLHEQEIFNKSKESERALKKIVKTKMAIGPLKELSKLSPPPLKWIPVSNGGATYVEVLMSGELVEITGKGNQHETMNVIKGIPAEIRPSNKQYRICAAFAGLRNFPKAPSLTTGRYRIRIMFGDLSIQSGPSGSKMNQSINFLDPYATGIVSLPEQLEYWPPIIITHVDISSKSNQELTVGAGLISRPGKYLAPKYIECSYTETNLSLAEGSDFDDVDDTYAERSPLIKKTQSVPRQRWFTLSMLIKRFKKQPLDTSSLLEEEDESEYTWWTKFYNSIEKVHGSDDGKSKHRLIIYPCELEKQPEFNYFQDWAEPISLIQGVNRTRNAPPKEESYCTLKCQLKIKPSETSPTDTSSESVKFFKNEFNTKFQEISSFMTETRIVVRIYIVQGLRLRSRDQFSESDAFVKIQFGNQKISDRANYVPNQNNPIFGKRFQMDGTIPRDHILHISVYDRDLSDDLIGCTCIDLEDRLRTKHRATVGISQEYSSVGYNVWRDTKSPYRILKEICKKHDLSPPDIRENKIIVGGVTFQDSSRIATDEDAKQRLSLGALKRLDEISSIGYKLVPEHVETRSLYRGDRPGVEQGKLQLWVEIFEADKVPAPIDITPTSPQLYEVRLIIWNTKDVILNEANIFGKKMSDIYLRAWLDDIDTAQYTDVHYRSFTGEGNFNWRMIFPIKYSKSEEMMVITKKRTLFGQHDTEIKLSPILYIQIWDNDAISADDFLGSINLDLSHCPVPSASPKNCTLKKSTKFLNLFKIRKIKGWFPARGDVDFDMVGLTGKVEMELQVLSETEAVANPAGLGRNPPNALPEPNNRKKPEDINDSRCCVLN